MAEQQQTVRVPGEGLLDRLAQRLGVTANAANIYGGPVERDGVTVIPVAKALYGLGGGAGRTGSDAGSGGGGGVILSPVGFIEMKSGKARFRPIREFPITAAFVTAGGILALLMLRTVCTGWHRLQSARIGESTD